MEKRIDEIVSDNVLRLFSKSGIKSQTELAKKSGVSQKTINFLLDKETISNPTATVLDRLAKTLKVKPWMLLIKDFPFDQVKGKPLKAISGPTYVVANAMEQESQTVQILMMEAASHVLMRVDKKQSLAIKEAQANYLNNDNQQRNDE